MEVHRTSPTLLFLSSLWLLSSPAAHAQGSFEYLQQLGARGGGVSAISADGAVLVGRTDWVVGMDSRAYRWTEATGMQDLGFLVQGPLPWSFASDVSADGMVIVGASGPGPIYGTPSRAFRWTATGGMQDLGALGAGDTAAMGASADGSVVVGTSDGRAFRWTAAGGMQDLGALLGLPTTANSVSDDGSVVVGVAGDRAFLWTSTTGMVDLGSLPGSPQAGFPGTVANAVSGDGSVVVGRSKGVAFRWTRSGGMVPLTMPGSLYDSTAWGVNEDGSVVVGDLFDDGPGFGFRRAFRWTAATGSVGFHTPASLPSASGNGCSPSARDVSRDGAFIAGRELCSGFAAAWRWHTSAIGDRYCDAVVNSTGRGALLNIDGSHAVAANDVTLLAEFLPANTTGFFIASRTQGNVPQPAGSQGVLCLGGAICRFSAPGQVQSSGAARSFSLALDLSAMPEPTGLVAVMPGETWSFQAWYRDSNPAPTSNFTDAAGLLFIP